MQPYMRSPEYLAYLIKNCGVRGYDIDERTEVCTRPDVDVVLRYTEWLEIEPSDHVLEVGCGLGRILKELNALYGVRPSGVDTFPEVIELAKERVSQICSVLSASPAEALPFSAESFDKIICWGVFDLTDQAKALLEMARVLRKGGALLLTGKGNRFEPDDEEAFLAERGSRRKGIPNHYTDFDALLGWASALGLEVRKQRFFRRRGDMMADVALAERPPRFYEYALLLERVRITDGQAKEPLPQVGLTESTGFRDWLQQQQS